MKHRHVGAAWGLGLGAAMSCLGCGGSGSSMDSDGGMMFEPVMCAGEMCSQTVTIEEYAVTYGPCCDEDNGGICGAALEDGCEAVNQPGAPTDECPEALSSIGTVMDGCCTPDGKCGVMSNVGFGCVERSDLNETAGGPLESLDCTP